MLKLARADLGQFGTGNERQDDVGRETLFEVRLDAEGVCGVDENTCVLWGNNGLDDRGNVVDVGQGLDAEEDVVERRLGYVGGIFGRAHNWSEVSLCICASETMFGIDLYLHAA